jgi:hypothetical protein
MKSSYKLTIDVSDYKTKEELLKTLKIITKILFNDNIGKSITRNLIFNDELKYKINNTKITFNKCICYGLFPFEDDKK